MQYSKCNPCSEFEHKKNILYETDNLFVIPSIGQITIEGYLLICSKKHYIAIGEFPENFFPELQSLQKKVRKVLSENYDIPIFFEHGPISPSKRGGSSVEHAHLHAVPINIDILDDLSKVFQPRSIDSFVSLKQQFQTGAPYLFYENPAGHKYVFSVPEVIPSQYIRWTIAVKIGATDRWDWKQWPGIEEFNKTLEKLKNKF